MSDRSVEDVRECYVDGCDRPATREKKTVAPMCNAHYLRVRNTGSVGTEPIRDYSGGECSVARCQAPRSARGMCHKHYRRWRRNGDPVAKGKHPGGQNHPFWKGDSVGYGAVHERLKKSRGPASGWSCVDCGGQAAEWSYTGDDPNEKVGVVAGFPVPYSTDLDRYVSRCVSCHRRFDLT